MTQVSARVEIETDDRIQITPPRVAQSLFGGEPLQVPWHVSVGFDLLLAFADESKLVELRDAITAALAERGGS